MTLSPSRTISDARPGKGRSGSRWRRPAAAVLVLAFGLLAITLRLRTPQSLEGSPIEVWDEIESARGPLEALCQHIVANPLGASSVDWLAFSGPDLEIFEELDLGPRDFEYLRRLEERVKLAWVEARDHGPPPLVKLEVESRGALCASLEKLVLLIRFATETDHAPLAFLRGLEFPLLALIGSTTQQELDLLEDEPGSYSHRMMGWLAVRELDRGIPTGADRSLRSESYRLAAHQRLALHRAESVRSLSIDVEDGKGILVFDAKFQNMHPVDASEIRWPWLWWFLESHQQHFMTTGGSIPRRSAWESATAWLQGSNEELALAKSLECSWEGDLRLIRHFIAHAERLEADPSPDGWPLRTELWDPTWAETSTPKELESPP